MHFKHPPGTSAIPHLPATSCSTFVLVQLAQAYLSPLRSPWSETSPTAVVLNSVEKGRPRERCCQAALRFPSVFAEPYYLTMSGRVPEHPSRYRNGDLVRDSNAQ